MRIGTHIARTLLAGVLLAQFAGAQRLAALDAVRRWDRAERLQEEAGASAEDSLKAARQRWERLSPAEKERLRERYERFKKLSPEDREALTRRSKRLSGVRESIEESLPEEQRAKLEKLVPEQRRKILREMAADEARVVGNRILDKLPPDLRERLEHANPRERRRFLEQFKKEQEERIGPILRNLGHQLGVEDDILDRLEYLPIEQRKKKFLEFVQRLSTEEITANGLPPGISPRRWERLKELPPERFFDGIMRLKRSHPGLAAKPIAGDLEGSEPNAPGTSDAVQRKRLRSALFPKPGERLELSDLSPEERQAELSRRRRERVLNVLRTGELLPPAELAEAEKQPDGPFFQVARRVLTERGITRPRGSAEPKR